MKRFNTTIAVVMMSLITAVGQKLPNVQKNSLFAPADIKIDGKTNEWHDQFQAYNNATDIYYTIANDNENLYLIIRAKYHEVIQKIIMGGITVTINHSTDKKDVNAVSVTYPVIRDGDASLVSNLFARKANPAANGDTSTAIVVDDLNQLVESKSKEINTKGIAAFADNTASVYNSEGLKTAELFDKKLQYTCEIAIPLKFLTLSADQPFSYHIKVNEPAPMNLRPGGKPPPPAPVPSGVIATTDFWGEYQLAKK